MRYGMLWYRTRAGDPELTGIKRHKSITSGVSSVLQPDMHNDHSFEMYKDGEGVVPVSSHVRVLHVQKLDIDCTGTGTVDTGGAFRHCQSSEYVACIYNTTVFVSIQDSGLWSWQKQIPPISALLLA